MNGSLRRVNPTKIIIKCASFKLRGEPHMHGTSQRQQSRRKIVWLFKMLRRCGGDLGELLCSTRHENANKHGDCWYSRYSHPSLILQVQMLIETCISQRMYTLEETCYVLQPLPYGVDPRMVTIIWQRLERENPEFFASYNEVLRTKQSKATEL